MAKSTKPANASSGTGKPSGKGRGNNPPATKGKGKKQFFKKSLSLKIMIDS